MKNWRVPFLVILILSISLITTQDTLAHQVLNIGNYDIEYGWVNEPAIKGQPNAIVINITDKTFAGGISAGIDISSLVVQSIFGNVTKTLSLKSLGENTPGQYIAPFTPPQSGTYAIHLGGSIGSTAFDYDIQPDVVKTTEFVQFPPAIITNTQPDAALWFGITGLLLAIFAAGLGVLSFNRKTAKG